MITAHVTKTPFPYWDPMWPWVLLCALDGHAEAIFGRFVPSHPADCAHLMISPHPETAGWLLQGAFDPIDTRRANGACIVLAGAVRVFLRSILRAYHQGYNGIFRDRVLQRPASTSRAERTT